MQLTILWKKYSIFGRNPMKQLPARVLRSILLLGLACGLTTPVLAKDTDMIINGKPVPDGAYPWQVRLYESADDQYGFCGGSIVGPKWILTAAHCALGDDNQPVDKIVVGYGSNDRTRTKRIESETIIVHPDYMQGEKADLALIKLKSAIPNASWIGIADAGVDREMLKPGSSVTVTGWGAMWDPNDQAVMDLLSELASSQRSAKPRNFAKALRANRDISEKVQFPVKLHEVSMQIVDLQECKDKFNEIGIDIGDTEICALEPGERNDSCYGDSGGPLIVPADNRNGYVQVGIVSWGKECGDRTFPGVYARLSSFNNWIKSQMGLH